MLWCIYTTYTTYQKLAYGFLSVSRYEIGLYSTAPSLFFQMGSKTNWDNSSKLQALSCEQH